MKPSSAVRRWLEYAGARGLEAAFSVLPAAAAVRAGGALGQLAWRPLGIRRGVVTRQIGAAFPDRSREWLRSTARACYRHFGREIAALARLGRIDPETLLARTAGVRRARDRYRKVAGGGGAIVVTGHIGNWELAGAVLAAMGLPVTAVVRRQHNRRFDRHLRLLRRRLGIETVYMRQAARKLPGALASGAAVALVADQDAGSRGRFVTYLGRPASTFRGPSRLALRYDVPLLFGAMVREADGYRAILEEVEGGGGSGGEEAERGLTRRWVRRLETEVRARPEQYFWFHRRWKTRPPA